MYTATWFLVVLLGWRRQYLKPFRLLKILEKGLHSSAFQPELYIVIKKGNFQKFDA